MADPLTVYLERDFSPSELTEDPGIELISLARDDHDYSELSPDELSGADVFVSYHAEVTERTLDGLDDLGVIIRTGAGYENVDLDACTDHGVLVTHLPQGPTEGVAQATLGLMISLANNVRAYDKRFRERGWEARGTFRGRQLEESTVGVVGMGLIGARVIELLGPFDPEVKVYDPYATEEEAAELGAELVGRDELLETADFVTIHVPLTEETHHMFGAEDFERMKSSAYLLNLARGGIYPDEDLAEAIREGEIAGAAIDVFEDESDAEANPLLDLDEEESLHCLLTPHSVCSTEGGRDRAQELLVEIVGRVREGELPINILNPEAYDEPIPEENLSPSFQLPEE